MSTYYSLKNILKYNAKYNVIFGKRSDGKTYDSLRFIIERYTKGLGQGAVIRRWRDDLTGAAGSILFDNLIKNGVISDLTQGQYNSVKYTSGCWYLVDRDESLEITRADPVPFCYAFALNVSEHYKSLSYPNITTCLFDEFIARGMYLPNEFILFANLISTIVRNRDNLTIIMCGNTVNKYCPYFNEMGLTRVKRQQPGTIDLYRYGESELTVAVEYTTPKKSSKGSDIYFDAFDNPQLKMITEGAWEIMVYPHLPEKYAPKQIVETFFIIFDGDTLHCDIVEGEHQPFIYIHMKTTPIKKESTDWVYSDAYVPRPNWRRNIMHEHDAISALFREFYNNGWIYYQDNPTGEIVRNYILHCNA